MFMFMLFVIQSVDNHVFTLLLFMMSTKLQIFFIIETFSNS